ELLSLCGGDLSSALPWLELHTLNFSYNSIICLDQSLPLSELEHLNLGYNCLQRAPALSPTARAKLHTLILRNNELETINGVEQLSSLQHLDLAYNLLLEHSQLAPLSMLHCLSTVLPKAGQLIQGTDIQVQTSVPLVCDPPERRSQEPSSGAGELSDSQSVSEAGMSRFRRKKCRVRHPNLRLSTTFSVDLCRPLLVGVLLDKQEMDSEGQEKKRIEMFLRVKQGVLLEVDMQRGMERCRLELDSLARVETTEAVWTREDTEGLFPALELHFDYIVKAKRRRCYVLLDDDPQQAAQVNRQSTTHSQLPA
ncbi:hypothetical protein GOODEAATRI_003050, partial [Goodea atripinnis]